MKMSVADQIRRDGYAFLPSLMPDEPTESVAGRIGTIVSIAGHGSVHHLRPKEPSEAGPNTYSGMYGTNEFPLHTDLAHWRHPPHYLMLRCLVGSDAVESHLLDSNNLISVIERSILGRALVEPRRPRNGELYLLRILSTGDESSGLLRWDERFIRPASPAGVRGVEAVARALKAMPRLSVTLRNKGDTLVINNWRMLHGRSAVPASATDRRLERAYLEAIH